MAHLRKLHRPARPRTLTDIIGNHYGLAVEASERNGWGQWHRADDKGIGMDRTVATGTGFIGQYSPPVPKLYESLDTCPDELLLFMHHVPYTHVLHSGKTVIQHIYDSHYDGADAVAGYVRTWKTLKGRIDDERYQAVLAQLEYQAGQAMVWRDAVTMWFFQGLWHRRCPGPRRKLSRPHRSGVGAAETATSSNPSRRGKRRRVDRPSNAVRHRARQRSRTTALPAGGI